MMVRLVVLSLSFLLAGFSGSKQPLPKQAENDVVEITALPYLDRAAIKQLLGDDLGGYYIVFELKLTPKSGEKLKVAWDDFLLRTDKDGERTTPFAPSQIAGKGSLVVSSTGGGSQVLGEDRGPVWGGYPGTGGQPGRVGSNGGGFGNATTSQETLGVSSRTNEKDNPLLAVLKQKVLPEKETDQPASGLLYFPMDVKQKLKDLELIYTTPAGKLSLRFR